MMTSTAIYTLTSPLHDPAVVEKATEAFLGQLGTDLTVRGDDFSDYGQWPLSIIFVRTGGTEGLFRRQLRQLKGKSPHPFYLLASGESNSLAASMEILSFLRQEGLEGEILHGSSERLRQRITLLSKVAEARRSLAGTHMGLIGSPSSWLIASDFSCVAIEEQLGITISDIPLAELVETFKETPMPAPELTSPQEVVAKALPQAWQIYLALKSLVESHHLQGLTLECFGLLNLLHNTGCLALAKLNAEGVVAACEGDVPAMLSMAIAQALTGCTGFQANPSSIDADTGEVIFAHCTIPLNMVRNYELDTHFESGEGVGIRGMVDEGPVTIFKVSGNLTRYVAVEGEMVGNLHRPTLCRTQLRLRLSDKSAVDYFLTDPIGNHHIILPGRHKALIDEMMKGCLRANRAI